MTVFFVHNKVFCWIGCLVLALSCTRGLDPEGAISYCDNQVHRALEALRDSSGSYDFSMEPRNILSEDTLSGWNTRKASAEEWCSGFWPGILWMDYMALGGDDIKEAAKGYTESLEFLSRQSAYDHDLGFLVFCSYGKGYEATGDPAYRDVILRTADTLATLFNHKVGTILSWPRERERNGWPHNTIMDNMINLDMLYWAAENGGDPSLAQIATRHAETTMKNHFRKDGSCYHVAVYDTLDGHFIKGVTHQGYSDSSMWSRGQAWAIYGYTMVYRHTRDERFLAFAQKVTDVYIERLRAGSDDLVPPWDMDDPSEVVSKDASAACVVASALLELSNYIGGRKGRHYREFAEESLRQLSAAKYQSRGRNVAFLLHSTGHHPAGSEIDASIVYADYYYLEALLKLRALNEGRSPLETKKM